MVVGRFQPRSPAGIDGLESGLGPQVLGGHLAGGQVLLDHLHGFQKVGIATLGGDDQGELPPGPNAVGQRDRSLRVDKFFQQGVGVVQPLGAQ